MKITPLRCFLTTDSSKARWILGLGPGAGMVLAPRGEHGTGGGWATPIVESKEGGLLAAAIQAGQRPPQEVVEELGRSQGRSTDPCGPQQLTYLSATKG